MARPAKQVQRAEARQLGIRDPPPPQLSGSNALLQSLAQGANRVSNPSSQSLWWPTGARYERTSIRCLSSDSRVIVHWLCWLCSAYIT